MPAPDRVLEVVREWVVKADNDLKAAAHTLKLGHECPTDTVCYHAQQCVEKYLKALLVLDGRDFPKTHDIERLCKLLRLRLRPQMADEEMAQLTLYATTARYPGWGEIALRDARKAVALARRVRREVRALLPRASTYRRRS